MAIDRAAPKVGFCIGAAECHLRVIAKAPKGATAAGFGWHAALLARTQSCRVGMGVHEGEVPVAATTQRLRCHRRRRMQAWNRLLAETGRITSLCSHPWIMEVKP